MSEANEQGRVWREDNDLATRQRLDNVTRACLQEDTDLAT